MVFVWWSHFRAELVSGRMSLVYHDCWNSCRECSCFKFAGLSFFPFGKEVVYGGGAGSFLLNVVWLILSGLPLALEHAALGAVLCVTIIGVPFGLQHFKLAKLALMPFGAVVY